jgi:hypothetical protein
MARHYPKKLRVHRKSYRRHGFTAHRKLHGRIMRVRMPPAFVPATTYEIEDLGLPGRGPKTLPRIKHPGRLQRLGYKVSESEEKRHHALREAVRRYGRKSVLGMLQEQINFRGRIQPHVRHVMKQDHKFVSSLSHMG